MNNAIALAKKLEREHGFDQPQAEGIAQAIHDHETEHLATKADLAKLETDMARLEAKLETGLAQLEAKLDTGLAATKADLARLEAKLDASLAQMDTKLETGLAQMDTKLETGLAQMEVKFAQLQVRLMTWNAALAGIIIAILKLT